jgi:hypothetical protein
VTTVRGAARRTRWIAALAGVVAIPALSLAGAGAGQADTRPAAGTPATVSADPLPTVQVNGIVWSQAVIGTTVYAGGNFSAARPAGAAPGTSTFRRTNLLAFDIRTGVVKSGFAPTFNGQVLAVTGSPDGKRLYAAGEFTTVNGVRRNRIAAFDTATGRLLTTFAPSLDYRARAIVATASQVYVGGAFSTANGVRRTRLAAFAASNGALLSWAPAANGQVLSMVRAPGGTRIVVGGQFTTISGKAAYGVGAVNATTGAVGSFAVNSVVRDADPGAGITSLSTDGSLVYGTGYDYGTGGNFEGSFAATPAGSLVWLEDCHGDTYSGVPIGGVFYAVGHAHACSTLGAFPETSPRSYHRALAFTTAATRKLTASPDTRYASFTGRPAPTLLTWFPDLTAGSISGQNQAAWSVTGNASYVVLGGEFPTVNGVRQQGLVRFAVSSLAPNKQGPMATRASLALTAALIAPDQARLTWWTSWDRDNERLTYTLRRTDVAAARYVQVFASHFWHPSRGAFTDTALVRGRTYTYTLTVSDPFGNAVTSSPVTVTIPG